MTNQYRATSPAAIAAYGDGVIELDLSPSDEADRVGAGVLELAPRPYRVMVDNYSVDGVPVPMDSVVELALPVEHEQALVDGGVLSRARRDAHPTVEVGDDAEPVKPARKNKAVQADNKE